MHKFSSSWHIGLLICLAISIVSPVSANPVQRDHIEVELISEVHEVQRGQPFWVALRLTPDEHWHTYWQNPGDSGLQTRLRWELPGASSAGPIQWPYPERIPFQHLVNYGYDGEVFLLTQIDPQLPADAERFQLTATASWLVCADICIPGRAELALDLPLVEHIPTLNEPWIDAFRTSRARLPIETPWRAGYEIVDGQLQLQVEAPGGAFEGVSEVAFFPLQPSVVKNNAAPNIAWSPERLSLTQAQSDEFYQAPDPLEAVLVVRGPDGLRPLQISAQPQLLAAAESFNLGLASSTQPLANGPAAANTLTAQRWGFMLLSAAVGGLLLNLMPCVFPVLSLKAMSLIKQSQQQTSARRLHGVVYTLGVVLSFIAVAALLLALRASGEAVGWGFQLQSPWFVALLAYLLFMMGLSLSGMLNIGARFMGVGDGLTRRSGYSGTFFTGVLAVVVASPCTAPFMGTAMGFAVIQTPAVALSIFAALGFGMALPFLLLAVVPGFARWLPRPGAWMESFKQFMAFPLYLTALWLVWVLGRQAGVDAMATVLGGMILLAFAAWLWHHRPQRGLASLTGAGLALAASLLAVAILASPLLHPQPGAAGAPTSLNAAWEEPFSQARLDQLLAEGRPVFLNMTADWCITCKFNERSVLNSPAFVEQLKAKQMVYLKGDWTNNNPEITRLLTQFGRSGVPLYVVYAGQPGVDPVVLPQILTQERVLQALASLPSRSDA